MGSNPSIDTAELQLDGTAEQENPYQNREFLGGDDALRTFQRVLGTSTWQVGTVNGRRSCTSAVSGTTQAAMAHAADRTGMSLETAKFSLDPDLLPIHLCWGPGGSTSP